MLALALSAPAAMAQTAASAHGGEGNGLATVPGRGCFAILRLYAPSQPAIDINWKPGDIEPTRQALQQQEERS